MQFAYATPCANRLPSPPTAPRRSAPPSCHTSWPAYAPPMRCMGFNYTPSPFEAVDEPFLLGKLPSSSRKGESYKNYLNSMHGVR
ncbi:hypothetical protein HYPSUDRAFT_738930 [Hypholoma sublateritium FD-334 SS-4]|uniref:Uncharacterized protein n=1 Tax=Hypholoma sublateritium (strain FD-334 SS-4) TaxID=945553 RepID=A0A0D2NXT6_HYPSF|nr:hypothetical protein HYPSUDRAFT_738930 [Hypholoma sublateritium FD-334 SS-4]